MYRLWILLVFSPDIYAATDDERNPCSDIACHHDNQEACGVRAPGNREVVYRLFRDKCDLLKYECRDEIKGFELIDIQYCKGAFFLNANRSDSYTFKENSNIRDVVISDTTEDLLHFTDTKKNTRHATCIQCDCDSQSETICAIRAEGDHFIVREFADECHMLKYNCEQNLHFSVTDKYICYDNKHSSENVEENRNESMRTVDQIQNTEGSETEETTLDSNCIQNDCISNGKVTCAARLQDGQFIVRLFDDKCHMLKYNCENSVHFSVTANSLCVENDTLTEDNTTNGSVIYMTNVLETTESALGEYGENETEAFEEATSAGTIPKNVVVSTYDFTENVNITVENFFAASNSMGMELEKLNEDTRRVIVQDTGPVNIFTPRTFKPNLTREEVLNRSSNLEYYPLLKYCFHKCPKKCPEIYKPVCAAAAGLKNYMPYYFFKNHCYMDIAKCDVHWAGFKERNITDVEELGFIFCGGTKLMNQMYMFPLIRILQKMGRLKKKAQLHFIMRNLGQFPLNLKG